MLRGRTNTLSLGSLLLSKPLNGSRRNTLSPGENNCDSLFVDQRVLTFQGQLIFREVLTSLAIDIVGGRTTEPFDQ